MGLAQESLLAASPCGRSRWPATTEVCLDAEGRFHTRAVCLAPGSDPALRAEIDVATRLWAATLQADPESDLEMLSLAGSEDNSRALLHGCSNGPEAARLARAPEIGVGESLGRDLIALGLNDLASEIYEKSGDVLGSALSRIEQGNLAEAASLLRSAPAARRFEAARLLATWCKRLWDWRGAEQAWAQRERDPESDVYVRAESRRRTEWARACAEIQLRGALTDLTASEHLLCENPLAVRREGDDLEFVQTLFQHPALQIPFLYGGGPLRCSWEFRLPQCAGYAHVHKGIEAGAQARLIFASSGTSTTPHRSLAVAWTCNGTPGPLVAARDRFDPDPDT
jgi:hypothetical protein